jgi:polyhydroxybutyrate depolymerase
MMIYLKTLINVLLLTTTSWLLISCSSDNNDDANVTSNNALTAGLNDRSFVHDGNSRNYNIYIPTTENNDSLPLVFNFHGFGGDANSYMQTADLRSIAEVEKFILIYPQGTSLNGYSHWNAALPSATNKSSADDIGFIHSLYTSLLGELNIDERKVYAIGYSNGGMFSYALACYRENFITAVVSVSGVMLDTTSSCTPSQPASVMHIHGENDTVIPYNGNADYNAVSSVISFWINFNVTDQSAIETNHADLNATAYVYNNGSNGVKVEHYKMIGSGHIWFSEMNQRIWNFLSQHQK